MASANDGPTVRRIESHLEDITRVAAPRARVAIEVGAKPDVIERVDQAFRRAGVEATVSASYGRKALGELDPITFIHIGLSLFLLRFASAAAAAAGKEAGQDAWRGLKRLVDDLAAARARAGASHVVIEDDVRGLQLHLVGDTPDGAYVALFALDLSRFSNGAYIYWDADRAVWTEFKPGGK